MIKSEPRTPPEPRNSQVTGHNALIPWCWVLFGLATTMTADSQKFQEWVANRPEHEELRLTLARLKTSFAKFPLDRCRQLVYRGWWLTGANLAAYQPELVPTLPEWRELA